MTLAEVVVAFGISALAVAGIVSGYIFSGNSAQESALSLAANEKALQRIEETRSARWYPANWPPEDQLVATNFPDELVTLDLASSGTGVLYATNFTQISDLSLNPPLRRVRVDCVWQFRSRLLTNSIETCRAPDQ